jgi:lysophospholipase L1-like esterase
MKSMVKILSRALLSACVMSGVVVVNAMAADAPKAAPKATAPHEAADVPAPKHDRKNPEEPEAGFVKRHEGFLKDLKALNGKCGIVFVGDSITDGWRREKPNVKRVNPKAPATPAPVAATPEILPHDVFEKNYGAMNPYNIGIGGDRTQHVLWRLDRGEVDGISPKVAVLMIGTNNLGGNSDEEIVAGDTKIVKELNEKLPQTKVLLLGIFPRGAKATDPARARIKAINEQLSKLDDGGKHVKYLDIGAKFLDAEGNLPKDIMPDSLHPNGKGYEIWAEATAPAIAELVK